jgi:arginase
MRRSIQKCTAKTVSVLSVPMNLGQPFLGPDLTPQFLREHGLHQLLADCGWRIVTEPDIVANGTPPLHIPNPQLKLGLAKNVAEVGFVCEKVFHQVKKHAETDNFLLILGGDHCIPIGTIPGIFSARKNTGVVWIDAHADLNVPATSSSGNMHGNPNL